MGLRDHPDTEGATAETACATTPEPQACAPTPARIAKIVGLWASRTTRSTRMTPGGLTTTMHTSAPNLRMTSCLTTRTFSTTTTNLLGTEWKLEWQRPAS